MLLKNIDTFSIKPNILLSLLDYSAHYIFTVASLGPIKVVDILLSKQNLLKSGVRSLSNCWFTLSEAKNCWCKKRWIL